MSLSSILNSSSSRSYEGERYACLLGLIADLRLANRAGAEEKRPAVMMAIDYKLQSEGGVSLAARVSSADALYQTELLQAAGKGPTVACEITG